MERPPGAHLDTHPDFFWRIGPPEMRFYWTVVHVSNAPLTWFRAGAGQAGVQPLEIGVATDLECLLRRWKPAQTKSFLTIQTLGKAPAPTILTLAYRRKQQ